MCIRDRPGSSRGTSVCATGEEDQLVTMSIVENEGDNPNPFFGRLSAEARRISGDRWNLRPTTRWATWNVRTLKQAGSLTNVLYEMRGNKIEVLGLAECRWRGSGQFRAESGELVLYSGGNASQSGVAIILSTKIAKSLY